MTERWEPAPRAPAASDREVHVWRIPLTRRGPVVAGLRAVLSDDELRRAGRFLAEVHRSRFILARGSLRTILGAYLAEEPARIAFETGPHGKPFLRDASLEFNLSHSADLAVLAVAKRRRVGIDIENRRPMSEAERIAERFFSVRECASLAEASEDRKIEAFFRIWTRKEAYIKALGVGITIPLDGFDVPGGVEPIGDAVALASGPGDPTHWTMRDFSPGEDYLGAIMVEGSGWSLRGFEAYS